MADDMNSNGALHALKSEVGHTVGPVNRCVCGVLVGGRGVSTVYLSTYVNGPFY